MAELAPASTQPMEVGRALDVLVNGEMMEVHGLMPWSSNYTLLATIRFNETSVLAVYKPTRGERPLWDFPRGSLAMREVAAYTVCQALGWNFIPPTVLREGLYGPGAVQLFIDADFESHYFTLRDQHTFLFQQVAAFDVIINNADRKAGHCLLDQTGHVWLVDHGLTFHAEHKLRTVIWDFAGQPLPAAILADLCRVQANLGEASTPWLTQLARLISRSEMELFKRRLGQLISDGQFPAPGPGRNVPYPLV
jgi:uncharacterized repeat protein (TIGR03843 family)